jgi:hypothetical protein
LHFILDLRGMQYSSKEEIATFPTKWQDHDEQFLVNETAESGHLRWFFKDQLKTSHLSRVRCVRNRGGEFSSPSLLRAHLRDQKTLSGRVSVGTLHQKPFYLSSSEDWR